MYIYYIQNKVNDKTYIGLTTQKRGTREYNHRYYLDKGIHHNTYLQRSWDKYGEENFEFGILEEGFSSLEELSEAEKFWIKILKSRIYQGSYNIRAGGIENLHSEETKEKMSKAQSGKTHTKESKRKMSKARKGTVVVKDETGDCFLVDKDDPRYLSGELVHNATGTSRSKESRRKMSRNRGGKRVLHIPSGDIYYCQKEAARQLNCSHATVNKHIHSKVKNPKFKYVEDE